MSGFRVAAGVAVRAAVGVAVRVRPVERDGLGRLRLFAVRGLMLRAGLNGRARPDSNEEGREDGVRIHPDAQAPSTCDAASLSRAVSSHAKT
ncbi:MAG: hypothetical protein F4164_13975 [Gemmatimonadales bacterium]|nr:hypothetical protein [Gemmatimonadales bacterium]MYG50442.1 hypothetical protein [Gemmatimonadales bacterium]MYK00582.1 hypothetical protein [Candidatus Palauibacter ramosifaciens]